MLYCSKVIQKLKEAQFKGESSIKQETLGKHEKEYLIEAGFIVRLEGEGSNHPYYIISL